MGMPVGRWVRKMLFISGLALVVVLAQDGDSVPPRGKQGRIHIATNPPNATAYLGGENLGVTPIDTPFQTGRHTLTVILNGEELIRQRVNIWPDSTTVIEKGLVMPYGSLKITTDPIKCNCIVYIDSLDVGSTQGAPLTINNIRSGSRAIRIVDGKRSKEYNVMIFGEKTAELFVDLKGE